MSRRLAVAVSGGRDSMALLHCAAHAARGLDLEVWALHVHHGLQAGADDWARTVERTCRRWAAKGLPLSFAMRRLAGPPPRGHSVEAWARAGRYAALAEMALQARCTAVLLAHHRADQAETFLLQALRGAGPAGLAAMPGCAHRQGLSWLRPWLGQPRTAIEAYVRRHRIAYVDDQSNDDPRFARNRLRLQVMPALRAAFPDAEAALADAAAQAAHARALIDEVARADAAAACDGEGLVLARWSALSPPRRREALRTWLAPSCDAGVAQALLDRLMDELPGSRPARWPLGELELRRYRGMVRVAASSRAAPAPPEPREAGLDRMGVHRVPGEPARLRVRAGGAQGLPLALLQGASWRMRSGAEQFQRAPGTPARSLKKQFQAQGIAAWSRSAPLLVAADGLLLFVPGLGMDARALARPGSPRVCLEWLPDR
jgi:tRNA(Ile)-lysidine synthase